MKIVRSSVLAILLCAFLAGCATGAWYEDMAPSTITSNVEDGATDVDSHTDSFGVAFVKPVDVNTVTTSTFFLVEVGAVSSLSEICSTPANAIPGTTVSCTSDTECTLTLDPSYPLESGKRYAICLTSEINYEDGNTYPGHMITFTTAEGEGEGEGEPADGVAPAITSKTPADGATSVAVNTTITAAFSEEMDSSTISAGTFTLSGGVTGTVTYDSTNSIATFTPTSHLSSYTTHTATVAGSVKDSAGNEMGADCVWSFTTSDIIAPSVSLVSPSSGATNLAPDISIDVEFSEDMDAATITADNITVSGSIVGAIAGAVSYNAGTETATFTPSAALGNLQIYTVTVGTGVKDAHNVALASPYVWSFTTKAYGASLLYRIDGVGPNDVQTGRFMASVGDIDKDGSDDFIVGNPLNTVDGNANAGEAIVYSGRDGVELQSLAGADANRANDKLGSAVGSAGDVDGDGYPDLIVGAPEVGEGGWIWGQTYIYSGRTWGKLYTEYAVWPLEERLSNWATAIGDVDGDDVPDFVLGVPDVGTGTGRLHVYSGVDGVELSYSPLIGHSVGEKFGKSAIGIGDIDDDGVNDFIVSASGGRGWIYAYSGADGSQLYSKDGNELNTYNGSLLGHKMDLVGDVNEDGYDDFIVGASVGCWGAYGQAYVLSGVDGTLLGVPCAACVTCNACTNLDDACGIACTACEECPGQYRKKGWMDQSWRLLGSSVAGAGDVDGDGYPDFIIGERGADNISEGEPSTGKGRVHVYSGKDAMELATVVVDGGATNDNFGDAVIGNLDVNGDGKPDFVVGAYGTPNGGNTGSIYVYISE